MYACKDYSASATLDHLYSFKTSPFSDQYQIQLLDDSGILGMHELTRVAM